MSRLSGGTRKAVKLPWALQKELGLETPHERQGRPRSQNGSVRGRKEQRKADRLGKRQHVRGSKPPIRTEYRQQWPSENHEEEDLDDADENLRITKTAKPSQTKKASRDVSKPISILKKPRNPPPLPEPSEPSSISSSRSSSPGLVLDANSRAFQDRAAQDDAEISGLEKKLGLKKNKVPKSFAEDGLDDLLEGLDEEDRGVKRKTEGQEWLEKKRRKTMRDEDEVDEEDDFSLDELGDESDSELDKDEAFDLAEDSMDSDMDEDVEDDISNGYSGEQASPAFSGFDSDEEPDEEPPPKIRENPYVPPVAPSASTSKYIPPSLRKAQGSEGASLERLKRQLQGHLNKLSEANLVSILGEIEKVYQSNPRQDVTSVLVDLLLTLFCNRSTLQNTFVILHAAFATAIYKVVGVDFGAELLSHLVDRFDTYHSDDAAGKEAINLISLLSNLFTFHMISSAIIFEHIRILLERLSENNTELLLRLIRDCGPQLRQDDPSSLKDIIQLLQKETARINTAGEQMSVRTKFMVETITDLKNNKMKAATNNAGLSSEHITLMRKVLGSLNEKRAVRASEPLRITRDDIRNSDKKGKWWLVGASWKGNEATTTPKETVDGSDLTPDHAFQDEDSIDLLALSRQYGMNTDVRRSIFVALLSAVDHQDGHMRVLKLRLKRNQEQEIPKVLLRCAGSEKPYNHYYTLVAKRLCLDKKMRKAFQFAFWAFFRRLGENADLNDDEEEDHEEDVDISEIANLAKVYAHLILDGAIPLGALKVLDLLSAKERTVMFVELLLIIVFIETKENPNALVKLIERTAADTPQMVKRLHFFIKKNVKNSDLVEKKDKDTVKRGYHIALGALKRLQSVDEDIAV